MQILRYASISTPLDQTSPFTQLPHEVNIAILSNLTNSQDLYSSRLTCKHINQIFSDETLWKIFCHKIYPSKKLHPALSYQKQFQAIHRQDQNWNKGWAKLIEINPNDPESNFEIENSEIHVRDRKIFHISGNKSIEVRNINNGALEKSLEGISGVDDVEIKSSGQFLTAWFGGFECCHDIKIWSLNDLNYMGTVKNCLRDYKIIDEFIIGKQYSMTYDRPPQLTFWNTHGEYLFSLGDAWHFEIDRKLVIYADFNFLTIVRKSDYKPLGVVKIHKPSCLTVTENHVILGHENGNVTLYNKLDGTLIKEIEASIQARVVAVHAYKNLFIIRYPNRIKTWNHINESFAYTVDELSYPFVIEDDRLYLTLLNGCVEIRNIEDGKLLLSIAKEGPSQRIIKLITDEDRLFIQDENHLRVFTKDKGILILKLDCKAFALEGCQLMTWSDQKITIRDYS